jgi:hypothetical protein
MIARLEDVTQKQMFNYHVLFNFIDSEYLGSIREYLKDLVGQRPILKPDGGKPGKLSSTISTTAVCNWDGGHNGNGTNKLGGIATRLTPAWWLVGLNSRDQYLKKVRRREFWKNSYNHLKGVHKSEIKDKTPERKDPTTPSSEPVKTALETKKNEKNAGKGTDENDTDEVLGFGQTEKDSPTSIVKGPKKSADQRKGKQREDKGRNKNEQDADGQSTRVVDLPYSSQFVHFSVRLIMAERKEKCPPLKKWNTERAKDGPHDVSWRYEGKYGKSRMDEDKLVSRETAERCTFLRIGLERQRSWERVGTLPSS